MNLTKQLKLYEECKKIIPGAAQTISKFPSRFPLGSYPMFIIDSCGNQLWDLDYNHYIDWTSGLGTNIIGYSNDKISRAIITQLDKGVNYSLSSELEYSLAKKLTELIPSAKMVKLFKTGSDATNASIRVAKAFTGKTKVIVCKECYHGTGDWFAYAMNYHYGIPYYNAKNLITFNYLFDIFTLQNIMLSNNDIACIILEPTILEKPNIEFLKTLREECTKNNVVLIFDEMVTGLRTEKYSIQSLTGVIPDLSCFGKSLGNGMSISTLVGREDIMQLFDVDSGNPPVFYSGTYFGECLSIAASIATLDELKRLNNSKYPTELGLALQKASNDNIKIVGDNARLVIKYNFPNVNTNLVKSVFMQEMANEGLLFGNVIYPNYVHTNNDIKLVEEKINKFMNKYGNYSNTQLKSILKGKECQDFNLRK